MSGSQLSRHAAVVAAALLAAVVASSCAGWVALDGRIAPASRGAGTAGAGLEQTVVWVDSLSPAAARRMAAAGRLAVLRERGRGWEPRVVAVAAGGTLRIENHDRVWHQAFGASPGGRFETAPARPGATRTVRFDSAGVVGVWCALHQKPAAVVRVLPHAGFARADRRGRFRLPPLPHGSYRVHAWHPEHGEVSRRVTLGGGRPDTLDLRFAGAVGRRGIPVGVPAYAAAARRPARGAARAARADVSGPRHEPRPTRDS